MMHNILPGIMIQTRKYFLLVYETTAAVVATPTAEVAAVTCASASNGAKYWSKTLGVNVWFIEASIPMLVLGARISSDISFIHVLAGERPGWIINLDWIGLEILDAKNVLE